MRWCQGRAAAPPRPPCVYADAGLAARWDYGTKGGGTSSPASRSSVAQSTTISSDVIITWGGPRRPRAAAR